MKQKTKQKTILIDGPDNSGKTTLVNKLVNNGYTVLGIPKAKSDGSILKVESEESMEVFLGMFPHIKTDIILDRGITSNIVYGELRGQPTDSKEKQLHYLKRLSEITNLEILFLDRNKIDVDFSDDLISLNADDFNKVIDSFNSLYTELKDLGYNIDKKKILYHSKDNKILNIL